MPPDGAPDTLRLFFYVQHLLGIGHLHRAARIAKALSDDGFRVRLVLGGPRTPGLDPGRAEIVQLPPVQAGPEGFATLVHPDGRLFDAADSAGRTHRLIDSFDAFAPDILLIEAFPFGRRQMRFELLPLIDRAQGRRDPPLIASSVRDILQRAKRAERARETVELVRRSFDLVLVHGDPALTRLENSFPEARDFADKVAYTGLVAPELPGPRPGPDERWGAVVSVGGGAVGEPLVAAALAARPLTRIADRPWLILTGPNGSAFAPDGPAAPAQAPGLRVARFVPDLVAVLSRAEVSVSQAGYNTVADLLVAGTPALLVPFARDGETEQTERAGLLEKRGLAAVLAEAELSPLRFAAAIDDVLERPRTSGTLDLDGAPRTGRILRDAVRRKRRRRNGGD